jgi:hypothetical protein
VARTALYPPSSDNWQKSHCINITFEIENVANKKGLLCRYTVKERVGYKMENVDSGDRQIRWRLKERRIAGAATEDALMNDTDL